MRSWLDLERRFRDLAPHLRHVRLDIQWGAAGEDWRLAGTGAIGPMQHQFELLCGVAGRLLEQSLDTDSDLAQTLFQERDTRMRWFRLLKHGARGVTNDLVGYESDEDGNRVGGNIYTATIQDVVEICANQCLDLEARFPVRDTRRWHSRLYDDYGKELAIGGILALITAIIGVAFG